MGNKIIIDILGKYNGNTPLNGITIIQKTKLFNEIPSGWNITDQDTADKYFNCKEECGNIIDYFSYNETDLNPGPLCVADKDGETCTKYEYNEKGEEKCFHFEKDDINGRKFNIKKENIICLDGYILYEGACRKVYSE